MSSGLLKASYITVKDDEKRVIDSNQMVSDRIQKLSEMLQDASDQTFAEGFSEGLDALNVEQLLMDRDAMGDVADASVSNEEMLSSAREEAENIMSEARRNADAILADANAQAQEILSNADAQAQAAFSDAQKKGYEEGSAAGYNDGMQKMSAAEEELNVRAAAMEEMYQRQISELEPRFVEVLTDIYSHIFHVDLSGKTELILYLLKDAIRGIDSGRDFLVHVSKDDYTDVCEHKEVLLQGLSSQASMEIIEDITLSKGECFVESEGGIFDCSLGTELELLKKELVLLSYTDVNSPA